VLDALAPAGLLLSIILVTAYSVDAEVIEGVSANAVQDHTGTKKGRAARTERAIRFASLQVLWIVLLADGDSLITGTGDSRNAVDSETGGNPARMPVPGIE